jgi:hypothetical protein
MPQPFHTTFRFLRRVIAGPVGTAIAVASVIFVAPLLAFSETTIKGILDRWLSQCIAVIDITQDAAEAPIVRLYTFGEMPSSLPLTFAANQGVSDRVGLINQVEQETTGSEPNLLVHALANQRCPGDLCPEQNSSAEKLTVRLKPVGTNYLYQFRVLTSKALDGNQLKVYIKPLQDETIACRVERATLSNYAARQPKQVQLVMLFVAVIILTLFLGYLRRKTGDAK